MSEFGSTALPNATSGTPKRTTLTRIAAILWGSGLAVFLGALILAVVYSANTSATENDLAGLSLVLYPAIASVLWGPLGIASLVLAIAALARREPGRGWAIALVAVNTVPVLGVLAYWVFGILIPNGA